MTAKSEKKEWMEAMRKVPSLTDETEHYREVFLGISQTVLKKGLLYDAITEYFDSDVLGRLIGTTKTGQLRMLAVGLGEGKHELHMLKKLSSHFASIRVTAVDPNKGMLETFCERLKNCDVTKEVECQTFPGTYAEFLDSSLGDSKFDFITIIHALYYMGDPTDSVKSLLSSLNPTGIMYADLVTDENLFVKQFAPKPWLTDNSASWRANSSSVVKSIAEKNGYTVVTHRVPLTYDCSSVLDEDSVYGNQILDFFSMSSHFRRNAPKDVVEDCLASLRENTSNDQDKLIACGDDDLLIISLK